MFYELANILLMSPPASGSGSGGSNYGQLIMIPLILIVFYFFMIRPQQKKTKIADQFRESMDKGAKIVTIGGIHARITEVKSTTFVIEAGNGVKFEIEKSAVNMEVTQKLNKPAEVSKAS